MTHTYSGFDGSITVTDDHVITLDFAVSAHPEKKALSPVRIPRGEVAAAEFGARRGLTPAYLRIIRARETASTGYNAKRDPMTLLLLKAEHIEAIRPLLDWLNGRRSDLLTQVARNSNGSRRDIENAKREMEGGALMSSVELGNLEKRLLAGESVAHVARARYAGKTGLLVVTDQRLLFLRDGMFSQRTEEVSLGAVTAVNFKPGLVLSKFDVVSASSRMSFEQVPKNNAESIVNRLRERMNGAAPAPTGTYAAPSAAASATASFDVTEQLSRLADLRDRGVLTDEEFATQKAKLLRV